MGTIASPLRIFYLEDNPLIVFHIEAMIEDLGHVFVGFSSNFADLVKTIEALEVDGALVDIDLADGRTGPTAAKWLRTRGIPSIFLTGQAAIAENYRELALAIISKPVAVADFAEKLELFRNPKWPLRT